MRYSHSRSAITHGTKLRQVCFRGIVAEGVRRTSSRRCSCDYVFLEQNRRGAPVVCGAAAIQKSSAQRRNNLLSSIFGELIVRQCNPVFRMGPKHIFWPRMWRPIMSASLQSPPAPADIIIDRPDRPSSIVAPNLRTTIRFSNRPVGVKRFQTIHHHSVDVARGLVLLFGISATALPSWVSRTRWNNLKNGLAVRRYGRSKRIDELTSSIVPRGTSFHRSVELECSPITSDLARLSCC